MKCGYLVVVWLVVLLCSQFVIALQKAVLEISLYERNTQNGKFQKDSSEKKLRVEGYFSPAGPVSDAEGAIFQVSNSTSKHLSVARRVYFHRV